MNPARLLVLAVLAALVAIVPASLHAEAASPQQAAVETLIGTVGPAATITLRHQDGSAVMQLQPGSYAIEVHDESASHNFHLRGPGIDQSTQVAWTERSPGTCRSRRAPTRSSATRTTTS